MNLNNISDEELDRLFKASADNFDPPFDPEAWKVMDQKLEQAQPRARWFKKSYLLFCFFAFISIVSIHQLTKDSDPDVPSVTTLQEERTAQNEFLSQNQKSTSKTDSGDIPNQLDNQQKSTDPIITGSMKETKSSDVENLRKEKMVGTSSQESVVSIVAKPRSTADRISRGLFIQRSLKARVPADRKVEESSPSSAEAEDGKSRSEFALLEARGGLQEKLLAFSIPGVLDSVLLEEIQVDSLIAKEEGDNQNGNHAAFLNSIQVAIAFAPDLTTVKFKDPEAVSANAGVLIGFPLTRKLSLVSGVVWANKVYSARAEDYSFNNGYTYTAPVDATCRVLDIPLNLRYTVLDAGRNSLAVQAGLSSYLMLHEEYRSGSTGYGSYPYYKEVANKNRHWFAVQNVSLVYSRALSPGFSLGVEPFVKIPYRGIGDGKVKLTSAGVFFSAGYTIKRKP